MRVCVVGEPAGWHVGRLAAALTARGHEAAVVRWSEFSAEVAGGAPGFGPAAVARADVVVVRGMPGTSPPQDRLEEVVFRMDLLARLAAGGTPVVNAPRALEIAIDKYLSLDMLCAAGLPVPRTVVLQNPDEIAPALERLGGEGVLKPLFGSRGRGIERVSLAAGAASVAAGSESSRVFYLQEFIRNAGFDIRILVVGDRLFAMRRIAAAGEWRTNVSLGGRPEPFEPPAAWCDLARRAAATVGAEVAGVDLLPATDGRVLVLEVNAVPGWQGLEAASGQDVTGAVAQHLEMAAKRGC
jgi:ribosomal protein S6--L-glutamate ligase